MNDEKEMTEHEKRAWEAYCEETAGDMHVMDYWEQLPARVQKIYLDKTKNEHS